MNIKLAGAAVLTIGMAGLAWGQVAVSSDAQVKMRADNSAYDVMPDTQGTGLYPATRMVDPRLSDHIVYRPADLTMLDRRKLGVLVWGNGGCSDDAASARLHLAEIASHGYVVIAPGTALSGPGAPPRPETPPRSVPLGIKTTYTQVAAGIDWALAENRRKNSPLYGRIDPELIAVSGHSCGGLQALQIAPDPRIHAVIIHNSGVFPANTNPIQGITIAKSALTKLHTPVLYVMGGPTDIAWPNGNNDFDRIKAVPAMIVSLNVGHGGTFHEPNGGRITPVDVAWLDWQLRHDTAAGRWFKGKDCRLCNDPEWTVRKKQID
jgi:dienelactone hydrolase